MKTPFGQIAPISMQCDNKSVKAIIKWNPIDRRSRGRPKTRWKDDVEADLRAMKITNWKLKPTLGCKAD
jgi:hypothetical protein